MAKAEFCIRRIKYTEKEQELLKSPVKPEPWLHLAVARTADDKHTYYAVYVWDTRQVVDSGIVNDKESLQSFKNTHHIVDNGDELIGTGAAVTCINQWLRYIRNS